MVYLKNKGVSKPIRDIGITSKLGIPQILKYPFGVGHLEKTTRGDKLLPHDLKFKVYKIGFDKAEIGLLFFIGGTGLPLELVGH